MSDTQQIKQDIKRVAVLGSGVMGAGIAAQVANAGVPVLLLDIVPKDAKDRNAIAAGAVAKMLKTEPAAFMSERAAQARHRRQLRGRPRQGRRVRLDRRGRASSGSTSSRDLYRRLDAVRKQGTPISSNTSTIPLAKLDRGHAGRVLRATS